MQYQTKKTSGPSTPYPRSPSLYQSLECPGPEEVKNLASQGPVLHAGHWANFPLTIPSCKGQKRLDLSSGLQPRTEYSGQKEGHITQWLSSCLFCKAAGTGLREIPKLSMHKQTDEAEFLVMPRRFSIIFCILLASFSPPPLLPLAPYIFCFTAVSSCIPRPLPE